MLSCGFVFVELFGYTRSFTILVKTKCLKIWEMSEESRLFCINVIMNCDLFTHYNCDVFIVFLNRVFIAMFMKGTGLFLGGGRGKASLVDFMISCY